MSELKNIAEITQEASKFVNLGKVQGDHKVYEQLSVCLRISSGARFTLLNTTFCLEMPYN